MKKLLLFTTSIFISGCMLSQIIHIPGDYPTIQEGIDAATTGDTVLVAEDTWYENINFNGKAITLGSEFILDGDTNHINNTIIDGSSTNASTVTLENDEDSTSVIMGLSISGGSGTWTGIFQAQAGGGILCVNAGAKIIYCNIYNNEISHSNDAVGGGICCMISNGNYNIIVMHNTISNNHANANSGLAAGGGVFIGAASPAAEVNATIANNIIKNNSCWCDDFRADGGGVQTQLNAMGAGTFHIYNNVFQNNSIKGVWTRGGGLCGIETGGYVYDNVFKDNFIHSESDHFRGAALAYKAASSEIEISGNQFIENTSPITASDGTAALSIMDSHEQLVFISRNFFYKNVANIAGAVFIRRGYNLIMTNNVFWENSGRWGGAIEFYNPETDIYDPGSGKEYLPARLINNTFAYNSALSEGGVLRFTGTHTPPAFFNCIFWGNTAPDGPDIFNNTDVKIVVSYSRIDESDISGPWTGGDNIIEDPLLTPGDSVCHIYGGPCMDAGIDELEVGTLIVEAPDIDFDGDPRPQGDYWDIGADECLMESIWSNQDKKAFDLAVSPNPSSGAVHLRYTIHDTRNLKFEVHSSDGVLIKSLPVGYKSAGEYTVDLDLSNLPNGIYFIRLQAGEMVETAKIVLLK